MPSLLSKLAEEIHALDPRRFEGRVTGLSGALIEVTGPVEALALGARVTIFGHASVRGEIVGFGIARSSRRTIPSKPSDQARVWCSKVRRQWLVRRKRGSAASSIASAILWTARGRYRMA
jgi:hypothetical protein